MHGQDNQKSLDKIKLLCLLSRRNIHRKIKIKILLHLQTEHDEIIIKYRLFQETWTRAKEM